MTTATAAETATRIFKPIQQFTRGWMLSDATAGYGVGLGFASGHDFWIVGRAGVLGECPAEVAIGALAFHAPGPVIEVWDDLPGGLTHLEVAHHYQGRLEAWGRDALGGFDRSRLERLDELGRRVVDAAPAALGPLFAGWRVMPIPDDPGPRVALTTHVLREMRGAAHVAAVLAAGLTPLDAILASTNEPPRTGPAQAERMGHTGPFRDPAEVREQRLEAEEITSRIMETHLAVLDPSERAELGELVETTRNAIDM